MPSVLEAATSLLNVAGGRALPDEPPGFAVLAAPRKSARGREQDALFLCLGLRAREAVAPERYEELLSLAALTFFGSPGSVTSALRQAVTAVNQKLLDNNLLAGQPGGAPPMQGGLIAAALREADLYAVQAGPGLVLVARPAGHERFPHTASRPLGLSNTIEAQYFHTQAAPGSYFCLSNLPARGWTDIALVGLGNMPDLPAVAARLTETAGGDAAALLGRFEAEGAPPPVPLAVAARQARLAAAEPAAAAPPIPTPMPAADAMPAAPAAVPPAHRPPVRSARGAGLRDFLRLKPRPDPEPSEAIDAAANGDTGLIPLT
ncbi:MAG: hypothetical protein ABI847_21675, partial [Anaerolineales bacterium]